MSRINIYLSECRWVERNSGGSNNVLSWSLDPLSCLITTSPICSESHQKNGHLVIWVYHPQDDDKYGLSLTFSWT